MRIGLTLAPIRLENFLWYNTNAARFLRITGISTDILDVFNISGRWLCPYVPRDLCPWNNASTYETARLGDIDVHMARPWRWHRKKQRYRRTKVLPSNYQSNSKPAFQILLARPIQSDIGKLTQFFKRYQIEIFLSRRSIVIYMMLPVMSSAP